MAWREARWEGGAPWTTGRCTLRLSFESNGWLKTQNGVDEQVAFCTGAAYLYPSVSNNFWLKGGVGLATAKETAGADELK